MRITLPDSSGEYQEKMIEDLLQEGEKLYDDVCTILNNKDV